MRPIVYLDSSDYSVLSDPARDSPEHREIRERLQSWARAGTVDFRYSQVHLSEMSPTRDDKVDEAVLRVGLLSDLCKQRCFIGYWEVLQLEGQRLTKNRPSMGTVLSNHGDWFSGIGSTVDEILQRLVAPREELSNKLKEVTTNRAHRRAAADVIDEHARPVVEQLAEAFPFEAGSRLVFGQYLLGQAPASALRKALDAAFRNPVFVIRWLHKNFETLGPAFSFLRGPSTEMHQKMVQLRVWVSSLRKTHSGAPPGYQEGSEIDDLLPSDILLELVLHSEKVFDMPIPVSQSGDVDWVSLEHCAPGLLTALKTHLQVALAGTTETPRKPLGSDFLDILHTVYAPYVDVFRADRTMAHFVKQALGTRGTKVVGSLPELIPAVEALLRSPSQGKARKSAR